MTLLGELGELHLGGGRLAQSADVSGDVFVVTVLALGAKPREAVIPVGDGGAAVLAQVVVPETACTLRVKALAGNGDGDGDREAYLDQCRLRFEASARAALASL